MPSGSPRPSAPRGGGAAAVAEAWCGVLGTTTQLQRPDVVAQVQRWLAEVRPESVVWVQRAMARHPERLTALRALIDDGPLPAVVIRGEEDHTCTADTAAEMARALGCEVVTVTGAGHMSGLENPEPVARGPVLPAGARHRCPVPQTGPVDTVDWTGKFS